MERDFQSQIVMADLSQFSKLYLVPLADLHEGARDADHDVSDGYIKYIAERDNARTILNGDVMNCAGKDTSSELWEDLVTPDDAYNQLKARLHPIKDKILMITRGGHEEAIFRKVGTDYMAHLAHDLRPDGVPDNDHSRDIPYKPDGGMIAIRLSSHNHTAVFTGWITHGWGGARTAGAKANKIEELAKVADVDFYILSHDHTQIIHRLNVLSPSVISLRWNRANYIITRRKLLINTGGFVTYKGYIRRKGYVPQDLGTPRIRLEVKKSSKENYYKDLHASM